MLLWLFAPLFAACFISTINRYRIFIYTVLVLCSGAFCGMVLYISYYYLQMAYYGDVINLTTFSPAIAIAFGLSKNSTIFLLMIAVLYPVALIYTIAYINAANTPNRSRFLLCFNLTVLAATGLAMSHNMLTMFIFYELITFATYPLIINDATPSAIAAGRKYLLHLIVPSTLFILPVMIFTYLNFYSLDFASGGIITVGQDGISPLQMNIMLLLVVFGVAKTAILPLHSWLTSAMVAPAPVSALLHAVVVVKSGLFFLMKILYGIIGCDNLHKYAYTLFGENFVTIIAMCTILYSGIMATMQTDIKKILAFSTIGQISYIIMLLATFNGTVLDTAMLQMIIHSIGKITLFFAAGSIYLTYHTCNTQEIKGLFGVNPIVAVAIILASLSIVGIFPAIGAIGKKSMIAYYYSGGYYKQIVVLVVSSLLSVIYLSKIIFTINGENQHNISHNFITPAVQGIFSVLCLAILFSTPLLLNS
jgi:multicomponent Na+:H+ antiporter subunit D